MDELIEQFAIEARELVQQASEDLLSLEANPDNHERLESAFRAIHTLKGSVGLFDLGPMHDVLHHAEDLLSQARSRMVAVDVALIDPLLAVIEWVEDSIDGISQTGRLSEAQEQQASRLRGLLTSELSEDDASDAMLASRPVPDWALSLKASLPASDAETLIAIRYEPHPECFFSGDDPLATISGLQDLRHLSVSLNEPELAVDSYDPFRCYLRVEAVSGAALAEVEGVFRLIPDQVQLVELPAQNAKKTTAAADERQDRPTERHATTMRVDATRIDRLIEIAGELVTAKNGLAPLAEDARSQGAGALAKRILSSHYEIERLVASLYGAVTQARMIPLETTFRRFPRLVRETSAKIGKALDLVIEGEMIEADREIVESLFEPLLHLVRNCLDHGIELEADRLRMSKPARGRILLRARQRGDRVEIEVADDGRGIDPDRVSKTAIDRGIATESQVSTLSERDILQFVFAPGFSTASSVSDLSGRGVGLDAVRNAVNRLGGTIEMESVAGSGTSFKMRLPISFSMSQLMIVEVGGERYGVPIADVIETHKVSTEVLQPVRAGQAFILRNRTIPLLYLKDLLQMPATRPSSGDLKVLIVRAVNEQIGVVVDAIAERTETLTRPLAGLLQGVAGIAGTTMLGDGKVLLVLNLEELVQ